MIMEVQVEVRGGSIIVTLPDTSYTVTYCKSLKGPNLHARLLPTQYDHNARMATEDFLTEAWQLAHLRARELGWIV